MDTNMLCSKEEMTMSIKYHQYGLGNEYGADQIQVLEGLEAVRIMEMNM